MTGTQILRRMGLLLLMLVGILAVTVALFANTSQVQAETFGSPALLSPEDAACLSCHGQPGLTGQLPSGEIISISIDENALALSSHAQAGITCVGCHPTITGFPHTAPKAPTRRDYTIQASDICAGCHSDTYRLATDSVHGMALAEGNKDAPACADCHKPHTEPRLTDEDGQMLPSTHIESSVVCSQCHNAIYQEYKASVHGLALSAENPDHMDVPSCINCHGVHRIEDPTTARFRLASPQMCGECHADPARMEKYGISTEVFDTYVADFHGSTVTIFQRRSPDAETNKAVCYDCHGVHNIVAVDDPQKGLSVRQNLLVTCQRCHPNATTNFPESWLSHYRPDREKFPLVYYVQLFYNILIPLVIGGMIFYVITDAIRRLIDRRKGVKHA